MTYLTTGRRRASSKPAARGVESRSVKVTAITMTTSTCGRGGGVRKQTYASARGWGRLTTRLSDCAIRCRHRSTLAAISSVIRTSAAGRPRYYYSLIL